MIRVLVRTDSSRQIGSGHLMRCLTLARVLQQHGATVEFACRTLEGDFSALAASEFTLHRLPGAAGPLDWRQDIVALQALPGARYDWCVVDHYQLDADWQRAVRTIAERVLVIDDLADRPHVADILLDQNLAPQPDQRYASLLPAACRPLLGPRYALLAPSFAALHGQGAEPGGIPRILLSFGGSDLVRLTLPVLQALLVADLGQVALDVVIGAQCADRQLIEACAAQDRRVVCHVATTRMAELMAAARIFVGAGGATSWERCCIGLPAVVVAVADNQLAVGQALADAGIQLFLGPASELNLQACVSAVALLLQAPQLAARFAQRSVELVDGAGAERVVQAMLQSPVQLRAATEGDTETLHQWRNHPQVRRFAGDSSAIPLAQHRQWLQALLADPQRRLLIGSDDGGPLGVLRYDRDDEDQTTVSIYLAPERLGQGGGAALLQAGESWLAQYWPAVTRIRAVIRADNPRSQRLFAAAGYSLQMQHYFKQLEPVCRANPS